LGKPKTLSLKESQKLRTVSEKTKNTEKEVNTMN
jgi:hypothetical protein